MSVHLSSVLLAAGVAPESVLASHEGYGLVRFTAGLVRSLGQVVLRDPQPNDPSHGLVAGNKTEGRRKRIMESSEWVIAQDQPLPQEKA
jgi:hypothetical protein